VVVAPDVSDRHVVPRPAGQTVITEPSGESIGAVAPEEDVRAVVAVDRVVAGPTQHAILSTPGVQNVAAAISPEVVIPGPGGDRVVARAAQRDVVGDRVTGIDHVIAHAAHHDVRIVAAQQDIVAGVPDESIATRSAVDGVDPRSPADPVLASETEDHVVPTPGRDHVGPVGPHEHVAGSGAPDRRSDAVASASRRRGRRARLAATDAFALDAQITILAAVGEVDALSSLEEVTVGSAAETISVLGSVQAVGPNASAKPVRFASADQRVVAGVASEVVGSEEPGDEVVAPAAGSAVGPRPGVDHDVSTATARQHVGPRIPTARRHEVVAGPSQLDVASDDAEESVLTGASHQPVGPVPADELVTARPAADPVVAAASVDHVVAAQPGDHVGAPRADDPFTPVRAHDRGPAAGTPRTRSGRDASRCVDPDHDAQRHDDAHRAFDAPPAHLGTHRGHPSNACPRARCRMLVGTRRVPFSTQEERGHPREHATAAATTQVKILIPGHQPMVGLLGQQDAFLKRIEAAFDSDILVRGNEITITGPPDEAEQLARLFEELLTLLEKGHALSDMAVGQTIELIKGAIEGIDDAGPIRPSDVLGDTLLTARGTSVAPKTVGQKRFVDAMRSSTVTFAIGPAGTGKTYLAVATAVRALQDRQVSRLILTRPAVEAGERLGFLPGTLYEKIDPYMRPLYDALFEMTGADSLSRLMEKGTVEVAPLAYMRGRSLNDAFIILDEAQNTSPEQMKMFLTRIGFGSKAVVNGDVTQTDLTEGQTSGLLLIEEILSGIQGISFCRLGGRDVVRHKIVQDIVEAYDRYGQQRLRVEDG
jgi:phosphate starvation-inducible PhoH-like protein